MSGYIIFLLAAYVVCALAGTHCSGLVDLGYAKHVPTYINKTDSGHNVSIYKNIRFANAPTGDLRFRAPDTNLPKVNGIQTGRLPWAATSCISSAPAYIPFPQVNGTWGHEDCLFLDVYVPEGVKARDNVPVLHMFFGSAYAFGSKDVLFSPMGLFDRMFQDKADKFIFVVHNYRLGMPGWTYSAGEDMDANLGLLDSLAAVRWTAKYISRFGGDGSRISTIGQSAGAGMLYYMMSNSATKLPFNQAFLSSPAAPPRRNVTARLHDQFKLVLDAANCTTLACLRSVPEETMLKVNDQLINHTPSNSGGGQLGPLLGFGPAPDGKVIPDMPLALFQKGQYNKGVKRLVLGSMADEGKSTSHDTGMPGYFPTLVRQMMPTASNATAQELQDVYLDPSNLPRMAWDWTTDVVFACNDYYLANVLPNISRRYIMSTPPATHGYDLLYYLYNQDVPVSDPSLVVPFQRDLLRYIQGQDMHWPAYGADKNMFNITDRFEPTRMPQDLQRRCELIKKLVLDPSNGA